MYFCNKSNLFLVTLFILILLPIKSQAKVFYLDGNLSGACSGHYSIANRACNGNDGDAYNNLQSAMNALNGGDTLFVRAGSYTRNGDIGGTVTPIGSLHVNQNGSASKPTLVSSFGTEQPVIFTQEGKMHYNPNPGDTTFKNSSKYYPWPAISVTGEYITVSGFKTFGQVALWDVDHVTIKNCDIGGGGPALNQGQALYVNNFSDVLIQNNKIHHSCWGESDENGATLQYYNGGWITVENNHFYAGWGADFRPKDARYASSFPTNTTIVRYNFFEHSTIGPPSYDIGVRGLNQAVELANYKIYQNIFYGKRTAISIGSHGATNKTEIYNNTIVNSTNRAISAWNDLSYGPMWVYNNIVYSNINNVYGQYWPEARSHVSNFVANYNMYYATPGNFFLFQVGDTVYKVLEFYKSGTGDDENAVTNNPNFVNPNGSRPEDFKRTSYPNDVSSNSPYGTHVGAYITGQEIIGVGGINSNSNPQKIPKPPSGIEIQ